MRDSLSSELLMGLMRATPEQMGCSESQITKIETGRSEPAQWLKEAIARELNIHSWEVGV